MIVTCWHRNWLGYRFRLCIQEWRELLLGIRHCFGRRHRPPGVDHGAAAPGARAGFTSRGLKARARMIAGAPAPTQMSHDGVRAERSGLRLPGGQCKDQCSQQLDSHSRSRSLRRLRGWAPRLHTYFQSRFVPTSVPFLGPYRNYRTGGGSGVARIGIRQCF